jgi:hypothetical protein
MGSLCHDLVVRQAHHEVYWGFPDDLILSLSKDEVRDQAASRNSMTMAAVQVKRPPPQGSAVSGS